MEVREFVDKCVDYGYEWSKEEYNGEDGYIIGSKKLDTAAHFTVDAIKKNNWPELKKQIVQGKDIYHVTRVVGYYSRTENWNKSKHGELKDRQKGDYSVKK